MDFLSQKFFESLLAIILFNAILLLGLFPVYISSQSLSGEILSEEFLAGLPASVRDEIEVQNQVNEEIDLQNLFRSETSVDKNKIILQKLKKQILALDKRISADDQKDQTALNIFGQEFFSTLQSSFMPVNVPNLSGEYIILLNIPKKRI